MPLNGTHIRLCGPNVSTARIVGEEREQALAVEGGNVIGLVVEVDHQLPVRRLSEHTLGAAAVLAVTKPRVFVN